MKTIPSELKAIGIIATSAVLACSGVAFATRGDRSVSVFAPGNPRITATPVAHHQAARVPGLLSGLPTVRAKAEQRPIAVMLDNAFPDARPQSGLSAASVVFEAPVEGGITRFEALYSEEDATQVGPIRSSRPYFIEWIAAFHPLFVHAGGSPAAQSMLNGIPQLWDIDALGNHPQFNRSVQRFPPHNLYGSTAGIRAIAQRAGQDRPVPYQGLHFGPPASSTSGGRTKSIRLRFGAVAFGHPRGYDVVYRYAPRRHVYLRSQGGHPTIDGTTGTRIAVSDVVVIETSIAPLPNDRMGRLSIVTTGEGPLQLFRDGRRIDGRWSRSGTLAPLRFLDEGGRPLSFRPGKTWIEVVPPGGMRST